MYIHPTTKKSTIDTHNKGPVEGREPPDSRVRHKPVPTVWRLRISHICLFTRSGLLSLPRSRWLARLLSLSLAFSLPTRGNVFASCSPLCLPLMYSFVLVPTSLLGLSGIPTHHLLHSYAIEEAARVKEKLNSRDPTAPESEVIGLLAHC